MHIPLLPGDSGAIRAAAHDITASIPQLRTAHGAAVRVEEILTGDHWQGSAFEAFARVVERKPLPQALDKAVDRMGQAAEKLQWFASRFDDNQDQLRHLQSQAASLTASAPSAADDPDGTAAAAIEAELRAIEERARAIFEDHRGCLDQVADLFDWLDDEPTFAQPPPSTWDRVTGAVGDAFGGLGDLAEGVWDVAWSFGTGVVEGFRDLIVGIWEFAQLLTPGGMAELWANREQIFAVLRYAWENPGDFFSELGRALLDLDMLFEDPARWLGRRVPDLLLALATGGAGAVGARAAGSVRGVRGLQLASRATRRRLPTDAITPATARAALDETDGIAGGLARIGADGDRFAQSGSGAFTRTDSALGRLATRADGLGRAVEIGRQTPGLILQEIRGFTDLPVDAAFRHLPGGSAINEAAGPYLKRSFGSLVTNGFTGQLGIVDGLLVGYPALSPAAYASIAGIGGVSVLHSGAEIHGVGQAIAAAATPGCP